MSIDSTNDHFPAGLPTDDVATDPEVQPYWDAAREGRLVLPHCPACDRPFWYPRNVCPRCGTSPVEFRPASGSGTVYTYTVARHAFGTWKEHVPFVVAYVTLAEGPTVQTNLVDCPADRLAVGLAVTAVFEGEGPTPALRFRPAA